MAELHAYKRGLVQENVICRLGQANKGAGPGQVKASPLHHLRGDSSSGPLGCWAGQAELSGREKAPDDFIKEEMSEKVEESKELKVERINEEGVGTKCIINRKKREHEIAE